MEQFREGQTATHKDGRKIVYKDGAWRLLRGAGASAPPADDTRDRIAMRRSGMPVVSAAEDPTTRIADPKRRDITRGSLLSAGAKDLAKAQPDVDAARGTIAALDEFDDLNEQIRPSGGMLGRAGNWVLDALGNDRLARMDQISNSMARHMRQAGEGAVSNYEGQLFRSMVGGYDKPYQTNRRYSAAARALAERRIEMHQFREAYLQANNTLVGADTMWARYRDNNPILDREGNVRKVPGFREYFSTRMKNVEAGLRPDGKPRVKAPPKSRRSTSRGEWSITRE